MQKLKSELRIDLELYDFIKQRFNIQLQYINTGKKVNKKRIQLEYFREAYKLNGQRVDLGL